MKKAAFILLIIMLASFTVAIILVGIQIQNLDQLRNIIITSVDQTKEIEISENINNIKIDSHIIDIINIYSTKENKIKVELNGEYASVIKKDIDIDVTNRSEYLHIIVKEKGIQKYISIMIHEPKLTLNVYIPASYNKELEIDAYYDNIYIEDIILEKLTITGVKQENE